MQDDPGNIYCLSYYRRLTGANERCQDCFRGTLISTSNTCLRIRIRIRVNAGPCGVFACLNHDTDQPCRAKGLRYQTRPSLAFEQSLMLQSGQSSVKSCYWVLPIKKVPTSPPLHCTINFNWNYKKNQNVENSSSQQKYSLIEAYSSPACR